VYTHCCLIYWTIENEEGVIYDGDSEDDEDYVWANYLQCVEEGNSNETKANNVGYEESPGPDEPDPYNYVYSNLPDDVNVLKPIDDYEKCGAKRFQYEMKGFCCHDGQIKLVEQETPPDLMRLWTSPDDNARHFRDHIRWFNSHFSFTLLYYILYQDTTDLKSIPSILFELMVRWTITSVVLVSKMKLILAI
jgi:hypothetical protein